MRKLRQQEREVRAGFRLDQAPQPTIEIAHGWKRKSERRKRGSSPERPQIRPTDGLPACVYARHYLEPVARRDKGSQSA